MSPHPDLSADRIPPEELALQAQNDETLLLEMLTGIAPTQQKGAKRENSSQGLMRLAEAAPGSLLPHWDHVVSLLRSDNGFSQYAAAYILASLAGAAGEDRVGSVLEDYLGLLEGESVMVAGHIALNAARIAQALPGLRERIVRRLVQGGPTRLTPEREELIKGYVITALGCLMADLTDRAAVLAYARPAAESTSPKSRKLAKAFLKQWAEA